jgi:Right handed beta helix region
MSGRAGSLIATTIAAAFVVALALAGTASAALSCDATIKKDIKLKKNLNCSASATDGLNIGKDGVTIDLNGHQLIGSGGGYFAVDDSFGFDRLTVKDGTLKNWGYGVYMNNTSAVRLSNLKIKLAGTNSYYGAYLTYGNNLTIEHVTVDNPAYGFYLNYVNGLKLTRSRAINLSSGSSYGAYLTYAKGKIAHLTANGGAYGLYAQGQTPRLEVTDSTFNNAGSMGAYIGNSLPLWDYNYILRRNTAKSAGSYGFYASYDAGGGGNKATGAGTQNCYNVSC